MEKKFNRSTVREISQRIQKILSEYCSDWDYELTINGGNFSEDKVKLNLEVRMKGSDGSVVVSDVTHHIADSAATRVGLKVKGHLIQSIWRIEDEEYVVTGYTTKRPKYPLTLRKSDGTMVKAPVLFLSRGEQIVSPTMEEFVKWFTMDTDSDAILESDAAICDNVQTFMEANYPIEDGDKFFRLVDLFNEKGIANKWAKRAYELLFKEAGNIKTAYLGLKVIYKSETEETTPKSSRKTKSTAK